MREGIYAEVGGEVGAGPARPCGQDLAYIPRSRRGSRQGRGWLGGRSQRGAVALSGAQVVSGQGSGMQRDIAPQVSRDKMH